MTFGKPKRDTTTSDARIPRESVVGGNACTMCLYNIPRASIMITVPALVILVSGAAMTVFIDPSGSWTEGLAMIALVCLVLGGAWTLGGVVFWIVAWWRLKPKSPTTKSHRNRSNPDPAGHDNPGVQLEAVISRPCDTVSSNPPYSIDSDLQKGRTKTDAEQVVEVNDTSVTDDVIYTVT